MFTAHTETNSGRAFQSLEGISIAVAAMSDDEFEAFEARTMQTLEKGERLRTSLQELKNALRASVRNLPMGILSEVTDEFLCQLSGAKDAGERASGLFDNAPLNKTILQVLGLISAARNLAVQQKKLSPAESSTIKATELNEGIISCCETALSISCLLGDRWGKAENTRKSATR